MYKDENINKYRMSINILVALMGINCFITWIASAVFLSPT